MWLETQVAKEFGFNNGYELHHDQINGYKKDALAMVVYIYINDYGYKSDYVSELVSLSPSLVKSFKAYAAKKIDNDEQYREIYERISAEYRENY